MIQELIALVLVFTASIFTIYSIVKLFSKVEETSCNCGGCDIKSEINKLKSIKRI